VSYADVAAATTISAAFSAADKAIILGVIETSYNGSATARAMYDGWIGGGKTIEVGFVAGKFQAFLNTGKLELDLAFLADNSYVTPTGRAVTDSAVTAIVHEIGHALMGTPDNWTTANYAGDNVDFVNKIYDELSLPRQISYTAYDDNGSILKAGYDYTNGATIDVAMTFDDDMNTSVNPTATRDLLVGGASDNKLITGNGDDFLVGQGGSDTLSGGAGRDTAVYLGGKLDYDVRLNADGTWSVRHARGDKTDGADTLRNVEAIQFDGGETYELAKKGLTYQTDFALVIDTTGSMGSSINSVKAQAGALIDAAFAGGAADARIGVVGFKDTTNGEPTQTILSFTDEDVFDDRKAAAQAAINSISVGGGGDTPETAFDGLLAALDGRMGEWRAGAAVLRVALFTDAPAKDGALAAQVSTLAGDIGATISVSASSIGSRGSVDSFTLSFAGADGATGRNTEGPAPVFVDSPDDPITPIGGEAQIQIFTINTAGATDEDLKAIAEANGGAFLNAPDNDTLIETLLAIINAPSYSLRAAETSQSEGNSGDTTFSYTVLRTGDAGSAATLEWAVTGTGSDPASADDFASGTLPTGTISFAAGETSKSFTVTVAGDTVLEANERFTVALSASGGEDIAVASVTSTILNDDGGVVEPPVPGGLVLSGPAADYRIAVTDAGALRIVDTVPGRDGDQTIVDAQDIVFADGTARFDATGRGADAGRLFELALDRAPDGDGLEFWTTALESGSTTPLSAAQQFVGSAEFAAKWGSLSNEAFVDRLYENLRGEDGDSSGAGFWTTALNNGMDRGTVLSFFANSAEARIAFAKTMGDELVGEVDRLYATILDRPAFSDLRQTRVDQLLHGDTAQDIAKTLVASREFANLYGSLSNTDFVEAVYENTLDRDAEGAGSAFWLEQLAGGVSRADMLASFADTVEVRLATSPVTHDGWVMLA
jgi:hypothetical protein